MGIIIINIIMLKFVHNWQVAEFEFSWLSLLAARAFNSAKFCGMWYYI